MTPDEVVERAKVLAGKEVLLTVRGRVQVYGDGDVILDDGNWTRAIWGNGAARPDLVDIRPAPLRIKPGGFYLDADDRVLIGRTDGRLFALGNMGSVYDPDMVDGLRAAKVVPA